MRVFSFSLVTYVFNVLPPLRTCKQHPFRFGLNHGIICVSVQRKQAGHRGRSLTTACDILFVRQHARQNKSRKPNMFQTAELGQRVSKKEFKQQELILREHLLSLQHQLQNNAQCQVVLDFAGVRGAGKGTSVNLLNKWMDERYIVTQAYSAASDVERERPRFWRYWRDLPPKGQIGIYLSASWIASIISRETSRTTAPWY